MKIDWFCFLFESFWKLYLVSREKYFLSCDPYQNSVTIIQVNYLIWCNELEILTVFFKAQFALNLIINFN